MDVEYTDNVIKILVNQYLREDKKIIIYPFGQYGKYIKKLLNEKYHIKEFAIIDNNLSKTCENIYSADILAEKEYKNADIIVACRDNCVKNHIINTIIQYKNRYFDVFDDYLLKYAFKYQEGYCPCCGMDTVFYAFNDWYRDSYKCKSCGSIPRQRGVMYILSQYYSENKKLSIHECSPSGAPFIQLKQKENYTYSYYYENMPSGVKLENGGYNENLESLTFEDNIFDIFITQDVMEHVNNPERAFKEIARVLKPDGIHIFTTPIVLKNQISRARICVDKDGKIENILPATYHRNPISEKGSLVTWDWGYDIVKLIERYTGMETEMISFPQTQENINMGLEGEYLEVFISHKRC